MRVTTARRRRPRGRGGWLGVSILCAVVSLLAGCGEQGLQACTNMGCLGPAAVLVELEFDASPEDFPLEVQLCVAHACLVRSFPAEPDPSVFENYEGGAPEGVSLFMAEIDADTTRSGCNTTLDVQWVLVAPTSGVEFGAVVHSVDGRLISRLSTVPSEFAPFRPNGPECPPTCYIAQERAFEEGCSARGGGDRAEQDAGAPDVP